MAEQLKKNNVSKTRDFGFCVSCEICLAVCPFGAIEMEFKNGQFLPKINNEKCTNCGICLNSCPAIDIDFLNLKNQKNNKLEGDYIATYTGHTKNLNIREKAASGGMVTTLALELIKNKEFDYAFVLDFNYFEGKSARLKKENNTESIIKASKSKYIPASVYNVIKALGEEPQKKYIIIGTSCQLYGIRKFIEKNKIKEDNFLLLGLFCDRTLNFNFVRYLESSYRKGDEQLIKIDFRTKEKDGWPGNIKLYFDSGRELILDRKIRLQLKSYFQLKRCLFCSDKFNKSSDISFGDCYIKEKENPYGTSSIIVRTKKGKRILERFSNLFYIEKEEMVKIKDSQNLVAKENNLEYAKIFAKKNNIFSTNEEIKSNKEKELSDKIKDIRIGEDYRYRKTKAKFFFGKIKNKSKKAFKGIIAFKIILLSGVFYAFKKPKKKKNAKNIIIVEGGLDNKGAQAMTFTVIDGIKRKYPNKKIYLFSDQDFRKPEAEKDIYNFEIMPWNPSLKIGFLSKFFFLLKKEGRDKSIEDKIKNMFENTYCFLDISGYALSSQWGFVSSLSYVLNIIIAKKFSAKYYIFPQSMGPFDYKFFQKIFLFPLMRIYLKYPKKIFIREEEGLRYVQKFTKENVKKSIDIVFQSTKYNPSNIYKKTPVFRELSIKPNSVALIPNARIVERIGKGRAYIIYKELIEKAIGESKNIYLLRHSAEDLEICIELKKFFPDNKNVMLITEDLNVFEMEKVIGRFDFIIASRYHSIVHAYKNGTPAFVIGWAVKYFELLKEFDQLKYFFDCRQKIEPDNLKQKILKLINQCPRERRIINQKIKSLIGEKSYKFFNL